MPTGYEDMTVAEIKSGSTGWNRPMLEAALEYEQAHANRKGAMAALESALADKEVIPDGAQERPRLVAQRSRLAIQETRREDLRGSVREDRA